MRRRPEGLLTILLLAGAVAWVLFDVGSPVVAIVAFAVVAVLQVPGQRAHSAARADAIAEFRKIRAQLADPERVDRLRTIQRVYGRNHPAVRRLVDEERELGGA